jgi:hypothetical protein
MYVAIVAEPVHNAAAIQRLRIATAGAAEIAVDQGDISGVWLATGHSSGSSRGFGSCPTACGS